MSVDLEFILGLLDQEGPAYVAACDFDGPHGPALRQWQAMGFLEREPVRNPVASCPHCEDGIPYRVEDRQLCNQCGSTVDEQHLLLWRLDLDAFLRWLAAALGLRGNPRPIDDHLWQLGAWASQNTRAECFFWRRGQLSASGQERLAAYRRVVILYSVPQPTMAEDFHAVYISLLSLLRLDDILTVVSLEEALQGPGRVHFDVHSGVVTAGDAWIGEIPVGSKEYFLLRCLAEQIDVFVSYADLKHFVQQHTGSRDTDDEATFCHRLKHRLKKWVPQIDKLIVTTNKGDGYRLRAQFPGPEVG